MTKETTSILLSIIIPSYNQLEGLKETITALSKFRKHSIELIVIDGLSTDGSPKWIKDNASVIDSFQIETDKGIYDSMNK